MFPAQALAETGVARGWQVALATDKRGQGLCTHIPADPILEVSAATVSIRRPVQALKGLLQLWRGTAQAKAFIRFWRPDMIIGFGGYPTFPVLQAAKAAKVRFVLHEQNTMLGRVNRIFAQHAAWVASGFNTLEYLPDHCTHIVTGNPVRTQIRQASPKYYRRPKKNIHLVIVGGSQGAQLFDHVIPRAICGLPDDLRQSLHIVQQCSQADLSAIQACYQASGIEVNCATFFTDIEKHLARAHYVISRAGASSLSELALMGKPSLLVPLAIAMDDHQHSNAQSLVQAGAADMLLESAFTSEAVRRILERRLCDGDWLKQAAQAARRCAYEDSALALVEHIHETLTVEVDYGCE